MQGRAWVYRSLTVVSKITLPARVSTAVIVPRVPRMPSESLTVASGCLVADLSVMRLPLKVRYHVSVSFLPFGIAAKWNLAQTALAPVSDRRRLAGARAAERRDVDDALGREPRA